MTESENGLLDENTAPEGQASPDGGGARRAGIVGHALEWFWGGAAMQAIVGVESVRIAGELRRRAELALELGQLAAEKFFEHGSAVATACELNRQAVYWALLASVSPSTRNEARGIVDESAGVSRPTFAELWRQADRALLARAAGGEERAEALESVICDASFVTFAELDAPASQLLGSTLRQVAQKLIGEIDTAGREVDRVWIRRFRRIGALALALALLITVPLVVSSWLEEGRDLARGKAWTASSSLADVGCKSPLQVCAASPDYFFHTLEEDNPWLAIDLGAKQTISAVRVKNRADCCADRAVPLIVETSLDNKDWQRVARRTEEFTDWKAKFAPTTARFVRLKVPRRTLLHLQAVRVLP